MLEPIPQSEWYKSQRGYFPGALYNEMLKNDQIWFITADLGYKQFDRVRNDFPERFVDCRASEQAMMGIAIGLALKGKIVFVHSMSTFVLMRPYEWIRNYIDHENIPVKLVGSGRDKDYIVDSFTHEAEDTKYILGGFKNIIQFWPEKLEDVEGMVHEMVINDKPSFISLTRK
jgi:transketolase